MCAYYWSRNVKRTWIAIVLITMHARSKGRFMLYNLVVCDALTNLKPKLWHVNQLNDVLCDTTCGKVVSSKLA